MVSPHKLNVLVSLASLLWYQRLSMATEGDGDGAGVLLGWEGAPLSQDQVTQAELDTILREGTFDDLIGLAMTMAGTNPSPACLRMVNCGRSLATMGRIKDFFPNTFTRTVNAISAVGGSSQNLAINTVHNLTVTPGNAYSFILNNGAAIGDQVDFTTENMPSGADFYIRAADNSILKQYNLATIDRVRYFTAVWTGTSWVVMQS
jgi:hypothetical protein